ncbi:MAG TPA: PilZ domain-containing protein [Syntrophales bacterium]|nr:PilZ domain-containing protein [Syntrophales bacterium]
MTQRRRYQRYVANDVKDAQGEVKVSGISVQLVDFSLGGLCVLSKTHFLPGEVSISVEFGNHGKIDLIGNVVRVQEEGDMWRIAIDLTKTYDLDSVLKG